MRTSSHPADLIRLITSVDDTLQHTTYRLLVKPRSLGNTLWAVMGTSTNRHDGWNRHFKPS